MQYGRYGKGATTLIRGKYHFKAGLILFGTVRKKHGVRIRVFLYFNESIFLKQLTFLLFYCRIESDKKIIGEF